jgi:hypothetical protein
LSFDRSAGPSLQTITGNAWPNKSPPSTPSGPSLVCQRPRRTLTTHRSIDLAHRRSVLTIGRAGAARSGQYALLRRRRPDPAFGAQGSTTRGRWWKGPCPQGRIVRLGAVVDDGCTGLRPAGSVRRADIGRDLRDTIRRVRRTRPRHGPHRQSTGNQLPDDRRARPTRRSQNDMKRRRRRHRGSLCIHNRRRAQGATPAPGRMREVVVPRHVGAHGWPAACSAASRSG